MNYSIIFTMFLFFAHNIYGQTMAAPQESFDFDTDHVTISGGECLIQGDFQPSTISSSSGHSTYGDTSSMNGPLHDSPCELLYNASSNVNISPSVNTQTNSQTLATAVGTNN